MDKALLRRIAGYSVILLIASSIAILPGYFGPRVEGDVLLFSFPDLEGEMVDQSHRDIAGKVVMVNLWGTWCPPCRQELPHLIRLKKMYGERGFEIVAIEFPVLPRNSEEERRVALSQFVEDVGINYTILMGGHPDDLPLELPTLKNAMAFPTNIFIGRDGKVHSIHSGFYEGDVSKYEELIEKLLAEQGEVAN